MIRTSSESATAVQDRTIGGTAIVAVLACVGLFAGTFGAAAAWDVVGAAPIFGAALTIAVGVALAVGLPALLALLGRTALRATPARRRGGDIDAGNRPAR